MKKMLKAFGVLYFLGNLAVFATIFVLAINSMGKYPYSPGWIFLVFPGLGMVSGYWVWLEKYGWGRSLVIAFSLICSCLALYMIFVVSPQMEKKQAAQCEKAQQAKQHHLEKDVQRLFLGVYSDDIAMVTEQLAKGVDVNARNETLETPLHITQNLEIARLLINHGADITAKDDLGMPPIFNKELPLAKILLEAGTDINVRSEKGNTLLIWWAYSGYLEGMKYLVENGVDINACNADHHNALDIAEHFQPGSDALNYLQSLNIRPCPKPK